MVTVTRSVVVAVTEVVADSGAGHENCDGVGLDGGDGDDCGLVNGVRLQYRWDLGKSDLAGPG